MAVILYPLSNEKSLRLMESENTLIFVVQRKATKKEVRAELESMFSAKVSAVRTMITRDGNKRAYVAFASETPAIDVATSLGLL
ncbi:MAG: 50S ribosomal protein L23 [Candidatus Woesearchaeota archaeon]